MDPISIAEKVFHSCARHPPRKISETPPSGAQSPLPLCAIIPAQVQSTKVYAEPPEKKIKDVQSAYIYHNSKPAKMYVVKAR